MASRLHMLQQVTHRIIISRFINTTSMKMEKALENLQKNPYYEKYASRIAELQKTSPEEFMERIENQQKAKEEEKQMKFASVDVKQFSSALNPKKPLEETSSGAGEHKLSDILRVELVEDKEAAEIQQLWEQYHAQQDVIAACIPAAAYSGMYAAMRAHPAFVLPLPRAHGYEFVLCQSRAHAVHCTPLLAFQVHGENAPECLTMLHYTELRHKGLVLMRGQYDKNVLNGREAQCLANQFQMYYNTKDPERMRLLHTFTNKPDDFKHMELISQMENITLQ